MEFYAEHFGVGDHDILEAPWVAEWIERNHNRLRRCEMSYRWFLVK